VDHQAALTFAEHRMRRRPDDGPLYRAYLTELEPEETGRAEAFFESGLDRRPVAVQWHRMYQTFAERNGHDAGLLARYDGYLKSDSRNASLIYLRGRIDPDWDGQEQYYRKSIEADSRTPWPWAGLAFHAAAAGRWEESLRDVQKARELKVDDLMVEETSL